MKILKIFLWVFLFGGVSVFAQEAEDVEISPDIDTVSINTVILSIDGKIVYFDDYAELPLDGTLKEMCAKDNGFLVDADSNPLNPEGIVFPFSAEIIVHQDMTKDEPEYKVLKIRYIEPAELQGVREE